MKSYILLGLILIIHALILTKLIFFPYPELFIYPYLASQGLKPYQQILDQHFPGLLFLPLNFDNLGMTTPEVARIWLIIIVILTQILLFIVSKQILKSNWKALIVNLLYLIWQPFFEGWVLWIDSFLPVFLLLSFYAILKKRLFLAGLALGVASVFKQAMIPLSLAVLIYLFWETKNFKATFDLLTGLILPLILMLAYIVGIGVFEDFWYWTVVFNLTIFATYGRKSAPSIGHILRVALVFGVSLFALRFLNDRLIRILIIFLLGALATAISRFDFVHFQPALPFAALATVYGLGRWGKLGKLGGLGIVSLYGAILVWWLIVFYKGHLGDKVFFFDNQTKQVANKIREYSKPSEKIFVFGAPPHLYQMADRLPTGEVFVFQFPWFLKVAGDRVLDGLKKDKPEVVVSDRTVKIENQPIVEFASEIDQYILKNYEIIDQVGTTSILHRK